MVASVPYVKASEPHMLETFTPEVTKAYITFQAGFSGSYLEVRFFFIKVPDKEHSRDGFLMNRIICEG